MAAETGLQALVVSALAPTPVHPLVADQNLQ